MMNGLLKISIVLVVLLTFSCKSAQKSLVVNKINFGNLDENPLFNGMSAEEGFSQYVYSNIVYPVKAMEDGVVGSVFVEFFVERDGSVNNVKIVVGADSILEAAALQVVNSSPNWTPGKIDGESVRMSYTIPINFRLTTIEKFNSNQPVITGQSYTDNTYRNVASSSEKVGLSEETILLKEVVVLGVGARKRS